MFSPSVFGMPRDSAAAHNDHLSGALIVAFSSLSFAEVARPLHFFNSLVGAWLLVSAVLVPGETTSSLSNTAMMGLLTFLLGFARGTVHDHYGSVDAVARFHFLVTVPARGRANTRTDIRTASSD